MLGVLLGYNNLINEVTMPKLYKRHKTKYPGVYYIIGKSAINGKKEKIFYVYYRRKGKQIEEKVGRQFKDDMSAAKASVKRAKKIDGAKSNKEKRAGEKKKWTIRKLWEEYKAVNPSLKRLGTDKGLFKNHLNDKFGKKEPQEIAPLDIDRLRITLLKKLKPATVWAALELLKRVVNFGVKRNLCNEFGFHIKMPAINNKKTEDLTPDQLNNLLEAMEEDISIQAKNLMKLVLYTGMRRGELFRLKWDDLDFEQGFILIREPKNNEDQKIPLSDSAKILLKNHDRPYPDSPYVFPGRNGNKRTDIKFQVNRIKEKAGLPKDFRPLHGLRHVYASMLASSGKVDMYQLQKLLTHKSPLMTQRYAHLRDESLKKASELGANIVDDIESNRKNTL